MARFDIRVLGFEDAPGKDPVRDLAEAFGIDEEKARQVVARAPVLVKRGVDEAQAETLFHLLRGIGAEVRIEPAAASRKTVSPPGSIPVPGPGADPLGLRPMPPLPVPDFAAAGLADPALGAAGPNAPVPVGNIGSMRPQEPAPPEGRTGPGTMRPRAGSMRPGTPGSLAPPEGDRWHCDRCNVSFAEHQIRGASNIPSHVGMKAVFVCPRCQQAVHVVGGQRSIPLTTRLLGSFAYPFQRSAPALFIGVALVTSLFGIIPYVGFIFMAALLAAFYFSVIRLSASGSDELPSRQQAADLFDLFGDLFRFDAALLVPYVPVIFLAIYMPDSAAKIPVIGLCTLLGLIYMPASVMVAVLSPSCLGPLNPVGGVMIMMRVPGSYALTTFAVAAALGLNLLVGAGVSWAVEDIPLVGWFLINLAGLPLAAVASRMLGVFLHHHEAELGLG